MIEVAFVPAGSTSVPNGVNRMLAALVEHLAAGGAVRPEVLAPVSARRAAVPILPRPIGPLSRRAMRRFDIVHVPVERVGAPHRLTGHPVVVTVTGLGGLSGSYPSAAAERADRAFIRAFRRLRETATVVTLTHATATHVAERLGIPPGGIAVIPLGVDHDLFRPGGHRPAGPPYVLHVGQFTARKNSTTLIDAFALAVRATGAPHVLTLAGRVDGRQAMAAAAAAGIGGRVVVAGALPDGDLAAGYRGADAVCVPSRYEGFGLPVIEAMASGAPVVISAVPALVEVAGGAALVVDGVESPEPLAAAIGEVLTSPERAMALREAGLARAAEFSWERCARSHADLYRRVVGDRHSA